MNLDDAVSAVCTITKGDLPISIWWTLVDDFKKEDRNLTTNDGIVISRNSQKLSLLNIDAVKARHRGNYTCYAKNKAGVTQYSAFLFINGESYNSHNRRFQFPSNFVICFLKSLEFKIFHQFCLK